MTRSVEFCTPEFYRVYERGFPLAPARGLLPAPARVQGLVRRLPSHLAGYGMLSHEGQESDNPAPAIKFQSNQR
jgi:hypothetical protein